MKTQKVQRRSLHLTGIADLRREVDWIATGAVRTSGHWTPAQNLWHVSRAIEISYDGADFRAPWLARVIVRRLLGRFLRKGFKPGFQLPKYAKQIIPPDDVRMEEAAARMYRVLDRIVKGEPIEKPSPIFGELTHEQAVQVHLRHAELHFSFLHPVEKAEEAQKAEAAAEVNHG